MTNYDQRNQQVEIQFNIVTTPSGKRIPLFKPPQAPHFVNRKTELETLLDALRPGKVVTFCGPGGIGKTALVAKAIWTLAPENESPEHFPDGIIFHTFYNQPNVDVALEVIAQALGDVAKPTPEAGAQRALANKQVLLVLDGTEEADDLLKIYAIVGGCGVIVTSRNSEDAFEDWNNMTSLPTSEAINLLQAWSQHQAADRDTLRAICKLIGNLPLAVRLVGRYLSHHKVAASSYLEWLKASPLTALHHGERQEQSIPILLERSLVQVSQEVQSTLALIGTMALASFNSTVISKAFNVSVLEAEKRLGHLVSWGLLNVVGDRYQVTHALIHTYARERLTLNDVTIYRLIVYYFMFAQIEREKGVEGYCCLNQEREHLLYLVEVCIAKELWQSAIYLVWVLDEYLDNQGFSAERQITLEKGIKAAQTLRNTQSEGYFIGKLGAAYYNLGQITKAIEYYEHALKICQEIRDRKDEVNHLCGLGHAYGALGQVERAIEYYEQGLAISRKIGDREGESNSLGGLGSAYHALGKLNQAIQYYKQGLVICRETGNQKGEGNHLGYLGNIYRALGQAEKALDYHKQGLTISREIGYREGESTQLGGLGAACFYLGQVEQAIEYYEQALEISREIGDRKEEGNHLCGLGNAYCDLGKVKEAIDYHKQGLIISRKMGDQQGESIQLGNLGNAYYTLGQVEQAYDSYKQGLAISRKIGHREGDIIHLGGLGTACFSLDQVEQSIEYYEQALDISREIGAKKSEAAQLSNLGSVYNNLGQVKKSVQYYQEALLKFEKIKSQHHIEHVRKLLDNLGGRSM